MKLFFRHLRSRLGMICVFLTIIAAYSALMLLYRLPYSAILYPCLLALCIGLPALLLDFFRTKRRHEALTAASELVALTSEELPEPVSVTDQDYEELIESLRREAARLRSADEAKFRDALDYYTVWAHQIKTPIAAMKLSLQYEDSDSSRRLRSDLFRIEQYIEMALTFLRLDAEPTDYVFREHSLDEIIRPVIRRFAPEFIGKKLRLTYEPITETVVTDEKWLSFVIGQVLSNSLKYTREGGIIIELLPEKVLCISDTGIGISPSDLPRIFDKGYTGFNGHADKASSGIGLYLCRRVCKNLGIGISARSESGAGTSILLDLSLYELNAE